MKALVLSGGGCKGAYEAGAVKHLIGELKNDYDIYCGVSVGALNSSFLSQFASGEEVEASKSLEDLWMNIGDKDVHKNWFPFGKLSILWKNSVLNSKPLQKTVRSRLDVKKILTSGKKLRVGATSLKTGEYRIFDEKYSDVPGAVLASSAFPAMFCSILLESQLWTDGGVREITPIKSAIDFGVDEIDIIICSPATSSQDFKDDSKALAVASRCIDIMADAVSDADVKKAVLYNELAKIGNTSKRYVKMSIIRPSYVLTSDSLDFGHTLLKTMFQSGYEDAIKMTSSKTV
jgi:NTE family protein